MRFSPAFGRVLRKSEKAKKKNEKLRIAKKGLGHHQYALAFTVNESDSGWKFTKERKTRTKTKKRKMKLSKQERLNLIDTLAHTELYESLPKRLEDGEVGLDRARWSDFMQRLMDNNVLEG